MWIFFFQGEAGIRNMGVTGVQPCALPIDAAQPADIGGVVGAADEQAVVRRVRWSTGARLDDVEASGPLRVQMLDHNAVRSEERRVGKECRSRWSPYH